MGSFIWYELMTTDADAASKFYNAVVGWTVSGKSGDQSGGIDYRHITRSDGGNAGGVLQLTNDMVSGGAKPGWFGYIHVPDVDAEIAKIEAEGGKRLMPSTTIEEGTFAMALDPFGAAIYLMSPNPPASGKLSDAFSIDRTQHIRWNELWSTDADGAVAFYSSHFGWTQQGEMDMGEAMGAYRFIQHNGIGLGAICKTMADHGSRWNYYIGVDDIDRAMKAVNDGGGRVLKGPDEIPGGEFSCHCIDPQGAAFGMVGAKGG